MLKVIIALGGKRVDVARVTDSLWAAADGDHAYRAFKTTLYRLSKLIGYPEAILLSEYRITLNPRYCWIDVHVFNYFYDKVHSRDAKKRDAAMDEKICRNAHKAVALYQGPFLHDESWDGSLVSQRESLNQRFLDLIQRLGDYEERDGRWRRALGVYRQGLEKDPVAEELYFRQMRCHEKLGQLSEAIQVYQRCKRILRPLWIDHLPHGSNPYTRECATNSVPDVFSICNLSVPLAMLNSFLSRNY